jgi:hypothetical protein
VILLADVFRVPLAAPAAPVRTSGWRGWAWIGRGALWPACGVVVALLTHLFWGAAEKAFIYLRF